MLCRQRIKFLRIFNSPDISHASRLNSGQQMLFRHKSGLVRRTFENPSLTSKLKRSEQSQLRHATSSVFMAKEAAGNYQRRFKSFMQSGQAPLRLLRRVKGNHGTHDSFAIALIFSSNKIRDSRSQLMRNRVELLAQQCARKDSKCPKEKQVERSIGALKMVH